MKKTSLFNYEINKEGTYLKIVPNLKVKKIKIIPLADVHIGSSGFDEKKFLEYLRFIKETKDVLCYLGGDILEMALSDSPGNAIFEQVMRPKEQMLYAFEKLKEIKDKIIFSVSGNHEDRSLKRVDIDPMYWVLKALGIEDRHSNYPIFVTIKFGKHEFNFYVQHGTTNSKTEGGRINAASNPSAFIRYLHFICMGHVHDSHQAPIMKLRWEIENNNVFKLKHYIQYVIITPAFYKYWKTYAAKAAWRPPSSGAVVPRLWDNGEYDVSS